MWETLCLHAALISIAIAKKCIREMRYKKYIFKRRVLQFDVSKQRCKQDARAFVAAHT